MNTKSLPQRWVVLLFSTFLALSSQLAAQQHCTISPNETIQTVSCFGGSDGSISLAPTGGMAPYTYQWSTGASSSSISGLSAGNYAFTLTDVNGCSTNGSYYVGQSTFLLGNISKVDLDCYGLATGSATLNPSGGTPPYTYQWSNGGNTRIVTGLSAGPISYTVTDSRGCTGTGATSILEPAPVWTYFTYKYACYGEDNGTAEIFANGGTPPYTYRWDTGATTSRITGLAPGMYGYTVTDSRGCRSEAGLVCIFYSPEPDAINITASAPACEPNAQGSASVNVVGGYGPFTYAWSNGATGTSISGVSAGTYTVTITDNGGCTYTASTTLINTSDVGVTVTELANGDLQASASGGTAPYTYAWSNGESTATATGYAAGVSYSVTATDVNGCTATASGSTEPFDCELVNINLTVAPLPNGNLRANATGGTAPYTYTWSNGETVQTANDYEAGSPYSVTVTDANGCTASVSGTVPGDSDACPGNVTFAGTIGNDQYLCAPGNVPERIIELAPASGGNGPIEYLWMFSSTSGTWDPDFYQPIPGSNSPTYQPGPLDATTHFVRCTRVEGCVYLETNPVTITVGDELDPVIDRPDRGCFGETVVFSVDNAPGAVNWTFNGPVTTNTTEGRLVEVTFVGAGPLSFSVTISTDDCTGVFHDQIMVANCNGIVPTELDEVRNVAAINPNPVQGRAMLEFGEELLAPTTVNVFNMNQNRIASYTVASATRRMELSLEGLPAGMYLVQIIEPGKAIQSLRLVKQ